MTTNLLGMAAGACVVGATAGLAGPLWALLLLGALLGGMTWISHTQDDVAEQIRASVDKEMAGWTERARREREQALEAAARKASVELDEAVATERARWFHGDAPGITPNGHAPPPPPPERIYT